MNKLISNHCAILLLMAAVVFYTESTINGQSFLAKMGNGLNAAVSCSCTDSVGNIYAVTSRSFDTADVNKWDVSTKTWSMYARLPNFYTYYRATCGILYGKFYLTGDNALTGNVDLMEYSGTWKKKGDFHFVNFGYGINSVKFKNKLYFAGLFDSLGGVYVPNIATFDGSVFSNAGFPSVYTSSGYFQSTFEVVTDSLFMTCREMIIKHTLPGTWLPYYTNKVGFWLDGLAYHNGMLYASSGNALVIVKNGSKVDSLDISNIFGMNLKSCKNKLYIAEKDGNTSNVYVIANTKDIKYVFKNEAHDSSGYSLISNNTNLYYKGSNGVKVNGTDYRNILEVIVDSIKPVGFDTIRGFVFWDKNNNYVKDGNDVWPINGYMRNVTNNTYPYLGSNRGTFEEIVFENANVEYSIYMANFDSCVSFNFSGNIKSKNTDPGITIDSLYFPLVRPTTSNKNLVLKSYSSGRARLLDTIPLVINISNKDCYFSNTTNGTVTVTLDAKTTFISSSPAYTSKNGNVITFSNLTFDYSTNNFIRLKVIYSNTSYSIGNTVRHYARLSNISGEDTLDNMDSIVQKIVYSYDPNSKHSVPEGKITKDLKNIRYYIDFQNLGNDDAIRVTVIDTLNLKIPVYEFQVVACSHPYTVTITPGTNIVTWVFDNINLKPKAQDEAASKGYIVFDAKLRSNVKVGDSIRNRAYIYFDYNKPVITNYAVISRVDPNVKIDEINKVESLTLKAFPNPAHHSIFIENVSGISQNLVIYDLKGARIAVFDLPGKETKMVNTESWAKGIYVLTNNLGENLKFVLE